MRRLALAAVLALVAAPAAAAPFAILHLNEDAIEVLDLGSLERAGERANYQKITVHRAGPPGVEVRLDRTILSMEADCAGRRTRVQARAVASSGSQPRLQSAGAGPWAAAEPDELRLACTGQLGGLQAIPSLDVARAILNSGSARSAD